MARGELILCDMLKTINCVYTCIYFVTCDRENPTLQTKVYKRDGVETLRYFSVISQMASNRSSGI